MAGVNANSSDVILLHSLKIILINMIRGECMNFIRVETLKKKTYNDINNMQILLINYFKRIFM